MQFPRTPLPSVRGALAPFMAFSAFISLALSTGAWAADRKTTPAARNPSAFAMPSLASEFHGAFDSILETSPGSAPGITESRRRPVLRPRHEEPITELLAAPLRFDYLKRPTTWLGLGLPMLYLLFRHKHAPKHPLSASVIGTSSSFGFNAGLDEAPLYRGWLLPGDGEDDRGDSGGHILAGSLFGVVQVPGRKTFPWSQALFSLYAGFITQRDDWRLSEMIFAHAWYDVAIFLLNYSLRPEDGWTIELPALQISF